MSTGRCDAMRVALARAKPADRRRRSDSGWRTRSRPTLGIAGTPTVRAISVRGISRTVDQAASGSTGDGSVIEVAAEPAGALTATTGSAVDQMSVPWKCERLEFG